ncbi:RHS repeat-associated core domain-containing protein [Pseudomonas peradeniyensis]|uniref:RHS repeat-associated core domain-containing protein n=1 Tax=Pseudomonas peradeniyensis TaxID=2745488 RepID=A0ABT2VF61_9PSED|nr:RHS repeat-associated core domain-containing protein [Pseudomonas peradeniyensis]MCU7239923.1 RHS repeat-associated core domain-containing protein [Pseudomonas peradeniyensis]
MLSDKRVSALLAVVQQGSILTRVNPCCLPQSFTYSPYGYHPELKITLGFNGERLEPITGHYLLGNGYRAFSPMLMRFNSPDSMSPFADGGLNVYGYCLGDPINGRDPSGHTTVGKILVDNGRKFYQAHHTGKLYLLERVVQLATPSTAKAILKDYSPIAMHGTSNKFVPVLENKVDLKSGIRQAEGPAFYATQDLFKALEYASQHDDPRVVMVFKLRKAIWKSGEHFTQNSLDVLAIREAGLGEIKVQKDLVFPMEFMDEFVRYSRFLGYKRLGHDLISPNPASD